ncbi:MAG TPA: hypothetical protein PLR25_19800 [Planctomycetaceae bacterium]|nr:hypothetical protein [Planctomycetaceae bacterium]
MSGRSGQYIRNPAHERSPDTYNWHSGWEERVLAIAAKYPIFPGEVGSDTERRTARENLPPMLAASAMRLTLPATGGLPTGTRIEWFYAK